MQQQMPNGNAGIVTPFGRGTVGGQGIGSGKESFTGINHDTRDPRVPDSRSTTVSNHNDTVPKVSNIAFNPLNGNNLTPRKESGGITGSEIMARMSGGKNIDELRTL